MISNYVVYTVISGAKIWLIFWGSAWNSSSTTPSKTVIEQSTRNVINDGYYNALSQYRNIKPPTFGGSVIYTLKDPPSNYNRSDIVDVVFQCIQRGLIPDQRQDLAICPMVIPQPKSRTSISATADGFHSWDILENFGIYFGWNFPFPMSDPFNAVSATIAHETAEIVTDPFFNDPPEGHSGFLDPLVAEDEIADLCENMSATNIAGSLVQPYWSNEDKACIVQNSQTTKFYYTEQVIANEDTPPSGIPFVHPANEATALNTGAIPAMQAVGLWLRRTVNAEAETTINNRFTLHIEAQI